MNYVYARLASLINVFLTFIAICRKCRTRLTKQEESVNVEDNNDANISYDVVEETEQSLSKKLNNLNLCETPYEQNFPNERCFTAKSTIACNTPHSHSAPTDEDVRDSETAVIYNVFIYV